MYDFLDEYKTGIDFIDKEHSRLFELADETYRLLKDNFTADKYDNIMSLINELRNYTKLHFKHEEDYMQQIGYKKIFTQKIEHNAFIEKMNELDFNAIENDQDTYIIDLLDFLSNWLVHHIVEKDKLINS